MWRNRKNKGSGGDRPEDDLTQQDDGPGPSIPPSPNDAIPQNQESTPKKQRVTLRQFVVRATGVRLPDWCCERKNRRGPGQGPRGQLECVTPCFKASCEKPAILETKEQHRRQMDLDSKFLATAVSTILDVAGQLRTLKEDGADVNTAMAVQGQTALHLACSAGRIEAVRVLLELSCDVDMLDIEKRGALHAASLNGHAEAVQLLLEAKANADPIDKGFASPLHLACTNGETRVVETLLACDAAVEFHDVKVQPLHYAALGGHNTIAQMLLRKQANVDCLTLRDLETPLMLAASRGHTSTVHLLLSNDPAADMRKLNIHKYDASQLAAMRHHFSTFEFINGFATASPYRARLPKDSSEVRMQWQPDATSARAKALAAAGLKQYAGRITTVDSPPRINLTHKQVVSASQIAKEKMH